MGVAGLKTSEPRRFLSFAALDYFLTRQILFLAVEYGIGIGVVVHLHLLVDLHILASSLDIVEQRVDSSCQVALLLEEDIELGLALGAVLIAGVLTLGLLAHMVDLEREDAKAVDGPGGTLGIDGRIGQRLDVAVEREEVAVDALYEVGAVLIALVDAALERHSSLGLNLGITDEILKVPLYGVYPRFEIEIILDGSRLVGICDRCVDVVCLMVVADGGFKDGLSELGEFHLCECVLMLDC